MASSRQVESRARRATLALAASTLLMMACDGESTTGIEALPTTTSHQVQVAFAGDGAGTVSVGSTTITCATGGAACAAPVPTGTTLSLTATPATGSTFSGWTGAAGCGTASTCAVRVDAPQTVTAMFARTPTHELTVSIVGTGAGSVASAPAGIACTGAGSGLQSGSCETSVTVSTAVTLTATPLAGSIFRGWSGTGGCVGTGPCTVLVSAAQTVTATFSPSTGVLALATAGGGSGTVTSAPAGIACSSGSSVSGTCTAAFAFGSAVTLTASPSAGSAFVGWSGACSGTSACTVTIGDVQAVTATFVPPPPTLYALTIATAGAGAGRVTSAPAGIGCTRAGGGQTGDCGTAVIAGTTVMLTATPTTGSTFVGWSGGGCSGTAPCTIAVNAAQTVTAMFGVPTPQVPLMVTTAGVGGGTVTSSPAGIGCTRAPAAQGGEQQTGVCAATFDGGRAVTLTAAPVAGSTFQGWSGGGCGGTGSCVVTMSAAQAVTATFTVVTTPSTPTTPTPTTFALFVGTAGAGDGGVSSNPGGITCTRASGAQSGSCTASFTSGTTITLTATPAAGSAFAGWSGGCTGTGPCVVSAAGSVTAHFATVPALVLTVTTTGTGNGSVSSAPAGIACARSAGAQSGTCAATYALGTRVTLNATPTAGSTFAGWTGGGCTGVGPCTVALSAAQSVTARFGLEFMVLSVVFGGTGAGTVTSIPAAINCARAPDGTVSGVCRVGFEFNTFVTLVATPTTPGSFLNGWTGACAAPAPSCSVTMSAPGSATVTLTADFTAPTISLTGVSSGGTYTAHPRIGLVYADDMGFGSFPLRVTWSVRSPAGVQQCAIGSVSFAWSFDSGPSCPTVRVFGMAALPAPSLQGAYTLTVQAIDLAGNLSAPASVNYTVAPN